MIATIDDKRRARITSATPGDRYWVVSKPSGAVELIPQKTVASEKRPSRAEVREAIRATRLSFPGWETMRTQTREP